MNARLIDALLVGLAVLAVADVAHLGLEPLWLVAAFQASLWLVLLARHVSVRLLLLVPALVVVLGVVSPGNNDDVVLQAVAANFAAYWTGRWASRGQRALMAALVVGAVLAIELQQYPLDRTDVSDVVYISVPGLLALAVGTRLARRAEERRELDELHRRLSDEITAHTARVVQSERERIGRELHDVVAQGAGTVIAQASAARLLLEAARADDASTALLAVEDSARDALADMRRLLDVLRDEEARQEVSVS